MKKTLLIFLMAFIGVTAMGQRYNGAIDAYEYLNKRSAFARTLVAGDKVFLIDSSKVYRLNSGGTEGQNMAVIFAAGTYTEMPSSGISGEVTITPGTLTATISGAVTVSSGTVSVSSGTVTSTVSNFPTDYAKEHGGSLDSMVNLMKANPMLWGEVYASPQDFTASYGGTSSITITGAPFTVDDANCYVAKIVYKPSGGSWTSLINAYNGCSITASSNVITVTGAGTPFATGDTYRVIILGQKKSYDATNDVTKVSEASPLWSRYAGPETILSASQAFTASWVDLESGYEIDCRGYNRLILYAVVDHTDGANYRFRALGKHTASDANEYVLPIKNVGTSDVQVEGHLYELNTDVDQSVILDWDVTGIPYVQLQIQVGTIGSGTAAVTSASVTKAW